MCHTKQIITVLRNWLNHHLPKISNINKNAVKCMQRSKDLKCISVMYSAVAIAQCKSGQGFSLWCSNVRCWIAAISKLSHTIFCIVRKTLQMLQILFYSCPFEKAFTVGFRFLSLLSYTSVSFDHDSFPVEKLSWNLKCITRWEGRDQITITSVTSNQVLRTRPALYQKTSQ